MLGQIAQSGLLFLAGMVTAVVTTMMLRLLFGSANYKKKFAELEKARDDAMMELLSRRDATEYDKARRGQYQSRLCPPARRSRSNCSADQQGTSVVRGYRWRHWHHHRAYEGASDIRGSTKENRMDRVASIVGKRC